MYCKSCGKQIDDDSKFCSFCGTKHNITIVKPDKIIRKETPFQQAEEKETAKKESTPLPKNEVVEKYDLTYQKETGAKIVGIVLILIIIIIVLFGRVFITLNNIDENDVDKAIQYYGIFTVIVRIVSIFWVGGIAKRQNRDYVRWGVLAFLSPALILTIIGSLKKLKKEEIAENAKFIVSERAYSEPIRKNTVAETSKSSKDIIKEFENNKAIKYKTEIFDINNFQKLKYDLKSIKDFSINCSDEKVFKTIFIEWVKTKSIESKYYETHLDIVNAIVSRTIPVGDLQTLFDRYNANEIFLKDLEIYVNNTLVISQPSTTDDSKNEIDKNIKNLDDIIADLKKYTKK